MSGPGPRHVALGLVALAALACGGLTAGRRPGAAALTDRDWVLVAVGARAAPLGAGGQPVTLRLETSSAGAGGFAGCNRYHATYVVDGDGLHFGPVASTRMACAAGDELEHAVLGALAATTTWAVAGSTLTLGGAAGPLLRFQTR
jgi:copper homeostasis protein (lipoprotein)